MFTRLKNGKWGYMLLTAVASLVLATVATLFAARSYNSNGLENRAHHEDEQTFIDRFGHRNESTIRFIN